MENKFNQLADYKDFRKAATEDKMAYVMFVVKNNALFLAVNILMVIGQGAVAYQRHLNSGVWFDDPSNMYFAILVSITCMLSVFRCFAEKLVKSEVRFIKQTMIVATILLVLALWTCLN